MRYQIRVTPNAKQPSVKQGEEMLIVKVDAPPRDGRANQRLLEILADHFKTSVGNIKIVYGHLSRYKIIEIVGGKNSLD
ncbi:MAG: DUF167 domain-containing protein [bacterium]|nr:DUF167 domain-containing protein [bacterium]